MSDEIQQIVDVVDDGISQAFASKMNCPHCDKEIEFSRNALYRDNKMTMAIRIEDGHTLQAETIGGIMVNTAKLMKARAKDLGVKIEVVVPAMRFSDKDIEIDFMSLAIKRSVEGDRSQGGSRDA